MRHRYRQGETGAFRHLLRHHHVGGRHPGTTLDLCRAGDRVQPDDLVPDADHGTAWRREPTDGTDPRCRAALPIVRMAVGQFPEPLFHHSRPRFHRHRLRPAARRCSPSRRRTGGAGAAPKPRTCRRWPNERTSDNQRPHEAFRWPDGGQRSLLLGGAWRGGWPAWAKRIGQDDRHEHDLRPSATDGRHDCAPRIS